MMGAHRLPEQGDSPHPEMVPLIVQYLRTTGHRLPLNGLNMARFGSV
jgi:hypothetical protein